MGQGVHRGRRFPAGDDDARSFVLLKIARDRIKPQQGAFGGNSANSSRSREAVSCLQQSTRLDFPMMVRCRTRRRRRRLDHVKAAHFLLAFRDSAPRCKVARVFQCSRMGRKEISIQRKDAFGLAEVVDRVDRLAKSRDCTGARVVVVYRLILVPLRPRKLRQNCF